MNMHPLTREIYRKCPLPSRMVLSLIQSLRAGSLTRYLWKSYALPYQFLIKTTTARTYFNKLLQCDLSDSIAGRIYHFRVWEPHVSALIQNLLHEGDIFCDVGANIGYYSLLGSTRVGLSGAVVAIEASPAVHRQLASNLALNSSSNVRTIQAAVTGTPGTVPIYRQKSGNLGASTTLSEVASDSNAYEFEADVPGAPIDHLLTPRELERLRLIKIDIEGAEFPVLQNLLANITRYPDNLEIICECKIKNSNIAEHLDIFDRFRAAGFDLYVVRNDYTSRSYIEFQSSSEPQPLADLTPGLKDIWFRRRPPAAGAGPV